jgi:hypothetical protein
MKQFADKTSKGDTMVLRKACGGGFAALVGGVMLLAAATAQAGMMPAPAMEKSNPNVQLAWCAAGFRVGPLGACVAGGPGPGWRGGRRCWIDRWGRRVCRW